MHYNNNNNTLWAPSLPLLAACNSLDNNNTLDLDPKRHDTTRSRRSDVDGLPTPLPLLSFVPTFLSFVVISDILFFYYFYLTEFLMDSEICGQTRTQGAELRTRSLATHKQSVRARRRTKKKKGIMRIHFRLLSWSEYKSVGCWTASNGCMDCEPVRQPAKALEQQNTAST